MVYHDPPSFARFHQHRRRSAVSRGLHHAAGCFVLTVVRSALLCVQIGASSLASATTTTITVPYRVVSYYAARRFALIGALSTVLCPKWGLSGRRPAHSRGLADLRRRRAWPHPGRRVPADEEGILGFSPFLGALHSCFEERNLCIFQLCVPSMHDSCIHRAVYTRRAMSFP